MVAAKGAAQIGETGSRTDGSSRGSSTARRNRGAEQMVASEGAALIGETGISTDGSSRGSSTDRRNRKQNRY
jgi:hypothetical protein